MVLESAVEEEGAGCEGVSIRSRGRLRFGGSELLDFAGNGF